MMGFVWRLIPEEFRAIAIASVVAFFAFAAGGAAGYIKGRIDASNKAEVARLKSEIIGLQTSLKVYRSIADLNATFADQAQKDAAENAKIIEEIRNAPPRNEASPCRESDDDLRRLRGIR